jgi:hypothetical protein
MDCEDSSQRGSRDSIWTPLRKNARRFSALRREPPDRPNMEENPRRLPNLLETRAMASSFE